ncbi:hypothetical protein IFR05_003104 [Cadophora sp. M221]|nr:hypothetical protein IFR05_003104 [Cadophora sp. M221]
MASFRRSTPLWQVDLPNRPLPLVSKDDSASSLVAQALENARDNPDGVQNPAFATILETELTNIWRKIEAQPRSYVMTREEFSVFNYFQGRFAGHEYAAAARRRYWDHLEFTQGAGRTDVKDDSNCHLPCESKDQDIGITDKMDASDTAYLSSEIIHFPPKASAQETRNSTGNFNIHDDEGNIVQDHKVGPSGDLLESDAVTTEVLKGETIPSAASSNGSTCSEDETDWEEDESPVYTAEKISSHHVTTTPHQTSENCADSAMNETKLELIGRLMDQSRIILNHETSSVRQCGSSTSTPDSTPSVTENTSTKKTGAKRQRSCGRDEDPDEDNERSPKRKGKEPDTQATADIHLKFACPYRKHNPRKYCIKDWQRCVLTPHATVARVKAHLYKYHLIHQCQRCEETFKSEKELDAHIKSDEGCKSRQLVNPLDGITSKLRKQIQCRKKAHPGQTEESRWKQIYETIFPGVPAPEPYFELPQDHDEGGPGSPEVTDLVAFHQYLRRVLEVEVNNEVEPIEERLRGRLIEIIDQAFSSFQAIQSPDNIFAQQPTGTIEGCSSLYSEKYPQDVEEQSSHQDFSGGPNSCSEPNSTDVDAIVTDEFGKDEVGYTPIELSIGESYAPLEPTVPETTSLEFSMDDFDYCWDIPDGSIDAQDP